MTTLRRYLAEEIGDDLAVRACGIVQDWLIRPEAITAVAQGIAAHREVMSTPAGLACAGLAVLYTAVAAEYTGADDGA